MTAVSGLPSYLACSVCKSLISSVMSWWLYTWTWCSACPMIHRLWPSWENSSARPWECLKTGIRGARKKRRGWLLGSLSCPDFCARAPLLHPSMFRRWRAACWPLLVSCQPGCLRKRALSSCLQCSRKKTTQTCGAVTCKRHASRNLLETLVASQQHLRMSSGTLRQMLSFLCRDLLCSLWRSHFAAPTVLKSMTSCKRKSPSNGLSSLSYLYLIAAWGHASSSLRESCNINSSFRLRHC
mmetsp:Transcript_81675/g.162106  ORF Transcript_81675/g.162106 Transcript_81675/m.162106 type:complete len:240 (+) Transcript_81675:1652-2371(+)